MIILHSDATRIRLQWDGGCGFDILQFGKTSCGTCQQTASARSKLAPKDYNDFKKLVNAAGFIRANAGTTESVRWEDWEKKN